MRKTMAIFATGLAGLVLSACSSDTPAAPAAQQPVAQGVDLPLPADTPPNQSTPVSMEWREDIDPLLVRNVDVADPQRREYIEAFGEAFRASLVAPPEGLELDGIVSTIYHTLAFDAEGQPLVDEMGKQIFERRVVLEYTFKDHTRVYRAGDKVEGTDWVIPEDWRPVDRAEFRVKKRNPYEPPGYMPPYKRNRKND